MLVYNYDKNFLFTGTTKAQKNPVAVGKYILPANSTTVEPVFGTVYMVPKFIPLEKKWVLVESDYSKEEKRKKEKEEVEKKEQDAYKLTLFNEDGIQLYYKKDGIVSIRPSADIMLEFEENKKIQHREFLKNNLDNEILSKAKEVTGGSTKDSVSAFVLAFQLRAQNPSKYTGEGLVVKFPIESFATGMELVDAKSISDYYNGLLIFLDKFRNQKIKEYLENIGNL